MKSVKIKRRSVLTGIATLMGSSLLPSTLTAISGALASDDVGGEASFNQAGFLPVENSPLSEKALRYIHIISDIIIPATDTPGAATAGVPRFIEHALMHWMAKADALQFVADLTSFMQTKEGFLIAPAATQIAVVEKLDNEMNSETPFSSFYRSLKELTVLGYYTSETGASEELAYDPVPGGFREYTLPPQSRAWST